MKQNQNYLLRELGSVPYLLPYGQMIADFKHGMQINDTGVYIWNLLEEEKSLEELLSACSSHYAISEENLSDFREDITAFLKLLISHGIIEDEDNSLIFTETSYEEKFLTIGNLGLKFIGPNESFPKDFSLFLASECTQIHQTISVIPKNPRIRSNGQLLLRNRELMILEQKDRYILLFPDSKHIIEIHVTKDGRNVYCYCRPPYSGSFQMDLFHALRLPFLYLAQKYGMVAIHSASLLYKGKAWIFSGHSGAGKSTHTNLWKELYHTPIINGDLNLLALHDGQAFVYGIPWCGTSGICDTKSYPLGGIILLKQAPQNRIEALSEDQKLLLVSQRLISPIWTAALFDTNLSAIRTITKKCMVCRLFCTKEPSAASLIKSEIDNS